MNMSKRDDPQLRVRIPEELKGKIEVKARTNRRTLTAEIVARLEASVAQDDLFGKSKGFEESTDEIQILAKKLDQLKERYKRQYQAEFLIENQAELNDAIGRLQKLLNQDVD